MPTTPKERFQAHDGNVAAHQRLFTSLEFELSADAAMLEYADQLTRMRAGDGNAAAAAGFKLAGAMEFLNVLKDLAEKPPKAQAPVRDNLNHTLK
jgi:hypothetical protein